MDTLAAPMPPLEALVAELVATGGWFERVIAHMRRCAAWAGQDDGDVAELLGELLCRALADWGADRDPAALRAATELLRSASERCAHEVLLVHEVDERPPRGRRSRGRRRR